jgi:hypothetical protein
MQRYHFSLRPFAAAAMLLLVAVAAPAAHAQSVNGSGETRIAFWDVTETTRFTTDVRIARNRAAIGGQIKLTVTTVLYPSGNATTGHETYTAESLTVVGNQAMVWARAKHDRSLHQFVFIDNGDGTVSPDSFAWDGAMFGLTVLPLQSGDIAVRP